MTRRARAFGALWGATIPPTHGMEPDADARTRWRARDLTALFVIGENPAQSDADAHHVEDALRRSRPPRRAGDLSHATAELAHVVLPAAATWCEGEGTVTNSERRVQRVRKATEPPAGAKDELWIISQLAKRLGHDWGTPAAEGVWNEFRVVAPHFAGGMSYARLDALGGIQWPCPDESHPGETFLHGRLWEVPCGGRPRRSASCTTIRRSNNRTRNIPLLLTTGRRLESYNTGVQTSGTTRRCTSARRSTCHPKTRRGSESQTARRSRSFRAGAASPRRRGSTPRSAPGLVFMTLHFPDEVATNRLTIDASDPKSGTAEFKACAVRVEAGMRRRERPNIGWP